MKALVIGATGATGKDLVKQLLQDDYYTEILIFVRRSSGVAHPKLKEIITDFDQLEQIRSQISGDVLFSCLGTTLKTAGSKKNQWHIDYEIPLAFTSIAKENGVSTMVLLSAYGASTASNLFYSRMKGQLEDAVLKLKFPTCIIFRPGLLLREGTDRAAEKISAGIIKFLNRVGIIKKFKPMPTNILAEKMAKAPRQLSPGNHAIELSKIFEF